MKKSITLTFLIFTLISLIYSQDNKISLKTDIQEVTVYLKGANIVRKATVETPSGNTVLKFTDLSDDIDPESIQIGVDNDNIKILSVNFQFNYDDSIKISKELNELQNKLKIVEENLKKENVKLNSIEEELTFLRENRIIGGKNEPLSIASYRDIYNFYSERVKTLLNQRNEVNIKIEDLQQEYSKILEQINQIGQKKNKKRTGEIVVNLFCKAPTKTNFRISYYIQKASWFPQYDISLKNINEQIELTLKGSVYQNTGEDWNNIKLKLVSTEPTAGNILPELKTYYLDYNLRPPTYTLLSNRVSGFVRDANTGEPIVGVNVIVRGTSIGTITNSEGYYSITLPDDESLLTFSALGYEELTLKPNRSILNINLKPIEMELEEVTVRSFKSTQKLQETNKAIELKQKMIPDIEQESKTYYEYEIKIPCTVKSENKSISFEIDNFKIDAIYEYHCVPKVDKDAFLIAKLINWENHNLITGEATMFFENTYIGKSILDLSNLSDTISLSFGRDKNIIVKREKVKTTSSKQFIGSKKEELRAWKIEVKNNKRFPINLILYDQIPVSTNSEIEVYVDNTSGGTINKETGIVKWNVRLEPYETKNFELKYRVKYPKDKVLYIE